MKARLLSFAIATILVHGSVAMAQTGAPIPPPPPLSSKATTARVNRKLPPPPPVTLGASAKRRAARGASSSMMTAQRIPGTDLSGRIDLSGRPTAAGGYPKVKGSITANPHQPAPVTAKAAKVAPRRKRPEAE